MIIAEFLYFNSPIYEGIFWRTEEIAKKAGNHNTTLWWYYLYASIYKFPFYGILTLIVAFISCKFTKLSEAKAASVTKLKVIIWSSVLAVYFVFQYLFESFFALCILPPLIEAVSSSRFVDRGDLMAAIFPAVYLTVFCYLLYKAATLIYYYRKQRRENSIVKE